MTILFELSTVACVCAALVRFWGQTPGCIYGVSLYYIISQPVWAGVQLHVLLPLLSERWHPLTFDVQATVAKRQRWLRVFVMSGIYMSALLLGRGRKSLYAPHDAPMETYLYIAAYATASCYATLAFVCLVKTWTRPWSLSSRLGGALARGLFLLAVLALAASICEPIRSSYNADAPPNLKVAY